MSATELVQRAASKGLVKFPPPPVRRRAGNPGGPERGIHWRDIGRDVGISAAYAFALFHAERTNTKKRLQVLGAVAALGRPLRRERK